MYVFGDSFDLYASTADAIAGYWDSSANTANFGLVAGRFGGRGLGIGSANAAYLVKSSGSNDAVHHIVCAFQQTQVLSGTTLSMFLQLSDGATNQVCIVFRSDGAILLTSATATGTVLATYTGATTLQSQWFAYEFEVVIHPTAGRFRVRKNNNTADDFDSGAVLNTRPGANSYANKLTLGCQVATNNQMIDDLLWRSDASTVPFVGDIRTYVRMPVSDASVVFSRSTGASNFSCVDEAQQNTATDYVFSANVGDADLYGIAPIAVTPAGTVAVTTRAFVSKSDAGSRSGKVLLKSGGSTVDSGSATLATTWMNMWRTDVTDPATGAAWTAAGVNSAKIGFSVTS